MKKILVIDDEAEIADALATLLSIENYDATIAIGGRDAIPLLERSKYDAILLDVMMPDVGGLKLLSDIRVSKNNKTTPVILMSASKEPLAPGAGFPSWNLFIKKPFDIDQILKAVGSLVGKTPDPAFARGSSLA